MQMLGANSRNTQMQNGMCNSILRIVHPLRLDANAAPFTKSSQASLVTLQGFEIEKVHSLQRLAANEPCLPKSPIQHGQPVI
jgi:hypothetical protein